MTNDSATGVAFMTDDRRHINPQSFVMAIAPAMPSFVMRSQSVERVGCVTPPKFHTEKMPSAEILRHGEEAAGRRGHPAMAHAESTWIRIKALRSWKCRNWIATRPCRSR